VTSSGDNVGEAVRALVIMGPAGSGKSALGAELAMRVGGTFIDADAHHPLTNQEKMSRGIALRDEDRQPWLETLASKLKTSNEGRPIILACSALKARYRITLAAGDPTIRFVCLLVPQAELARRLQTRSPHFFNPTLLQSQLAALEVPHGDTIDGTLSLSSLVTLLGQRMNWPLIKD
jgi:gluconokinase